MQEKNKLLVEKVKVLEEKLSTTGVREVSYASVLRGGHAYVEPRDTIRNVPAIIVQPKHHAEAEKTKKQLLKTVKLAELGIPVRKVVSIKNGSVAINCENNKDVAVLRKAIEKKVGTQYSVLQEELNPPRIKIVGIGRDYSKEELKDTIVSQNQYI